jgi:VWFA-related protein
MRKFAAALLASLIAIPVFPQFTETIEVRVINVDVVVTKDGHPVTGLTKDDFTLLEDGKPQTITNFLELRGEDPKAAPSQSQPGAAPQAPPADRRARNVVIFVDSTSITPFTRNRVFTPMDEFLRRTMREGDHVMLITWSPGLKVELPFTNDIAEATKTLERLVGTVTTGALAQTQERLAQEEITKLVGDHAMNRERDVVERPNIRDGILTAQNHATQLAFEQAQRVEAIKSILTSLRGLNGRNSLVMLTNELSKNPGLPIFMFLDTVKDNFDEASSYNASNEAKRFEQPSLVKEIADVANSIGVTLYPIAPSGLAVGFGPDEVPKNGTGQFARDALKEDGLLTLRQIASATGGSALTGSNNFDLAFNTLAQDMSSYYSLGYHTEGQRKDAVRSISVKLRKKGYDVRTREAFVERSSSSEMEDAVAANLLYPVAKNDLSVSLSKAGAPSAADQQVVFPVYIKIPTSGLTLIPDGTDLVGQFSSYTAFMRRDGKVSAVKQQQHQIRFPADSLKRRKEITVKYDLTVDDRTDDVSVGIMDDTSHVTGFARMQIKS